MKPVLIGEQTPGLHIAPQILTLALMAQQQDSFLVGAVILAAGRSTRMGRPKLLLPWGQTSVLGHLIGQWRELGARQIAVVCASGDRVLQGELDRLGFAAADRISNPAPGQGMFSSVQCAARWPGWREDLTHWAIVLGDQPHLRRATLRAVLEFSAAQKDRVCQPARDGRPRHPVVLPEAAFRQLAASTAANLKEFLAAGEVAVCALDDAGLDLDLDRPEDYLRAWEEWGAK